LLKKNANIPMPQIDLQEKSLWIFDVDNTLVTEVETPEVFPDAISFCEFLENQGKTIAILTNVGRLSARQIHDYIIGTGLNFALDKTFTAGSATAAYIYNRTPDARCFVISEGGSIEDFIARGLNVVSNPPVDIVAVGADRGLTFQELNFATKMVHNGAELICICGSRDYPGVYLGQEDIFIGELSITAAIEHATGVKATVIGKPLPEIFLQVVKTLGYKPDTSVMVGDNLTTDIAGGNAAGLTTVFVKRNDVGVIEYDPGGLDKNPNVSVETLDELIRFF
jgi:HAD superfamily hydrolase (TIGR01450 family)